MNWPIGSAEQFRGVYDIAAASTLLLYEREAQGQYPRAGGRVGARRPGTRSELIGENAYAQFRESLDVIGAAGTPFDVDGVSRRHGRRRCSSAAR